MAAGRSHDLTPLHQAAIENDAAEATRLLEGGADRAERYYRGGYTALHFAAEYGAVDVCRCVPQLRSGGGRP
jgi:ankyrin repeat protein